MSSLSLLKVTSINTWNLSGGKVVTVNSGPGRVRAPQGAVKQARGSIFNSKRVYFGSSFLGFSRVSGDWRDAGRVRNCVGYDGGKGSDQRRRRRHVGLEARASSLQEAVAAIMEGVKWGWTASPPTWEAAFISVGFIFVLGAPLLFVGLTKSGIISAYVLGSIIWRAYGGQGLLTIVLFYILVRESCSLQTRVIELEIQFPP